MMLNVADDDEVNVNDFVNQENDPLDNDGIRGSMMSAKDPQTPGGASRMTGMDTWQSSKQSNLSIQGSGSKDSPYRGSILNMNNDQLAKESSQKTLSSPTAAGRNYNRLSGSPPDSPTSNGDKLSGKKQAVQQRVNSGKMKQPTTPSSRG